MLTPYLGPGVLPSDSTELTEEIHTGGRNHWEVDQVDRLK